MYLLYVNLPYINVFCYVLISKQLKPSFFQHVYDFLQRKNDAIKTMITFEYRFS